MSAFAYLIPEAPASLSATEATAYTQRRERCLWCLGVAAAEYPDYVPDEYYLAIC